MDQNYTHDEEQDSWWGFIFFAIFIVLPSIIKHDGWNEFFAILYDLLLGGIDILIGDTNDSRAYQLFGSGTILLALTLVFPQSVFSGEFWFGVITTITIIWIFKKNNPSLEEKEEE